MNRSLLFPALLLAAPLALGQSVVLNVNGFDELGMDDAAITPDGHYAIVRENTLNTTARVYDLESGTLAAEVEATLGFSGAAADGVACTNTRGVVSGSELLILDLTNLATNPLLVAHNVGFRPHDLAITPDGSILAVRGGAGGGMYLFDLATGVELLQAPGDPPTYAASPPNSFAVDTVEVTNDHAVMLSITGPAPTPKTRVTIFELHPAGGGPPAIVFETGGAVPDQEGAPHDLAITPDGDHVGVRSEFGVALYALDGPQTSQVWTTTFASDHVHFDMAALDSIVATNERIVTISRYFNTFYATQLDIFDLAGTAKRHVVAGDPHDLTLTPNNEKLLMRTSAGLYMYNMSIWPAGPVFGAVSTVVQATSHTGIGAGLDSIEATNERVVGLFRDGFGTVVRFFHISGNSLVDVGTNSLPDPPIDVAISPNGAFAAVTGLTSVKIFDLNRATELLEHEPATDAGYWPWCDGVVLDDRHVVAFGYTYQMGGWLTLLDLFPASTPYCDGAPNTAGDGAFLYATGTPSVAANDLVVVATDLPAPTVGYFFYGTNPISAPFGDGTRCVGGPTFRFPFAFPDSFGTGFQAVDYTAPPQPAGVILPGSTWYFQMVYRDPFGPGGNGFNATSGVEVSIRNLRFVPNRSGIGTNH